MRYWHKVKPLTSRSEIFEADLYRMDSYREGRYGSRRVKDVHRLKLLHATTLTAANSLPDFPSKIDPDDLHVGGHICDSNANPAVYCVYNESHDINCDSCVYCGQPEERK